MDEIPTRRTTQRLNWRRICGRADGMRHWSTSPPETQSVGSLTICFYSVTEAQLSLPRSFLSKVSTISGTASEKSAMTYNAVA